MSNQPPDIALALRTLARLIETKALATFGEQDAAHLREAASELERLRSSPGAREEQNAPKGRAVKERPQSGTRSRLYRAIAGCCSEGPR